MIDYTYKDIKMAGTNIHFRTCTVQRVVNKLPTPMLRRSPSFDEIVGSVLHLPHRQPTCHFHHLIRRHVRASMRRHHAAELAVRGQRAFTVGCDRCPHYVSMSVGGPLGGRNGDAWSLTALMPLRHAMVPPTPSDSCMAPRRILINSLCH